MYYLSLAGSLKLISPLPSVTILGGKGFFIFRLSLLLGAVIITIKIIITKRFNITQMLPTIVYDNTHTLATIYSFGIFSLLCVGAHFKLDVWQTISSSHPRPSGELADKYKGKCNGPFFLSFNFLSKERLLRGPAAAVISSIYTGD